MSSSTDRALVSPEPPITTSSLPTAFARRLLATDSLTDLGRFAAIFVVFFGLDRATDSLFRTDSPVSGGVPSRLEPRPLSAVELACLHITEEFELHLSGRLGSLNHRYVPGLLHDFATIIR